MEDLAGNLRAYEFVKRTATGKMEDPDIHSVAQADRVCMLKSFAEHQTQLFSGYFCLQDTIVRFLYSTGTKQEVERYLRIFSSASNPSQPAKFAVIKVGGDVLAKLDELALSLSMLYRVGLYPVILHGARPQLNSAMDQERIVPNFIDGIRVTSTCSHFFQYTAHLYLLKPRFQDAQSRSSRVLGGEFKAC